jgi:two-component system chemotaxis response regulator CheY
MSDMDTRILVVDDSSTMRRILRATLMRIGFTDVTEAGDGAEALLKCREAQFDIVLTDWNMPEVDGLELTIKLRQKDNYKKVPIMMVTTEGGKQDVVEALMQGVSSYIVKPFTADILKAKMSDLLALAE